MTKQQMKPTKLALRSRVRERIGRRWKSCRRKRAQPVAGLPHGVAAHEPTETSTEREPSSLE